MNEFAIPAHVSSFQDAVCALKKYLIHHEIQSVLLGISGGADSVLTLHLLTEAAKELTGFRLFAAHVNFRLRGEESSRDENFVHNLKKIYPQVKFFFNDYDTLAFANSKSVSVEMAARELRHSRWREIKKEYNIDCIVTGHNAHDNEETLLLNLLRGSSPTGLKG